MTRYNKDFAYQYAGGKKSDIISFISLKAL